MEFKKIFIIGSGLMGSGIAQACAQAGISAVICDLDQAALDKAMKSIAWSAGKLIEKGKVQGSIEEVMGRISATTEMAPAAQADLIIEAVFENLKVKKEVFAKLEEICSSQAVVASNTSAIPITELATDFPGPERFLGLHFFNPVPMMQAVEVIRGIATSDDTFARGRQFVLDLGKEPIMVNRDLAGFVINRINFPSTMEAMRLVEQGVATIEDIDKGLRLASGRRMGIFETGDLVGLDVTYGALMAMYQETGEERWYPPMILRRKVKAGQLGRKTGAGWYAYDEQGKRIGPVNK
ncbi:MAG: 3-hydroxyacyl-CoA dehydrogenase family protein [Desulfarculaceae bacterium]|jgi:3-hydroxybutyryl-CoA dehydrogenase